MAGFGLKVALQGCVWKALPKLGAAVVSVSYLWQYGTQSHLECSGKIGNDVFCCSSMFFACCMWKATQHLWKQLDLKQQ